MGSFDIFKTSSTTIKLRRKRAATAATGTAKGKKAGVDVVFAVGVMDAGAGQIVGAAFIVDSKIEDYYKETIRQICHTVRVGDDFAAKK